MTETTEVFADPFAEGDKPTPACETCGCNRQCVPDYAYEEVGNELARTQHQLTRALERVESLEERNKELEEMYSCITSLQLSGRSLTYSLSSGSYVVVDAEGQRLCNEAMLWDAWLCLRGDTWSNESLRKEIGLYDLAMLKSERLRQILKVLEESEND